MRRFAVLISALELSPATFAAPVSAATAQTLTNARRPGVADQIQGSPYRQGAPALTGEELT
jgi:hypothetical protein